MFLVKDNKAKMVQADEDSILTKDLPAGLYKLDIHESFFGTSIEFTKTDIYKGGKIIKNGVFGNVWDAVDDYNSDEAKEARDILGIMHKVGFIFNGKPGTGKTFLAGQIAEKFVKEEDAIGLIVNRWAGLNIHKIIDDLREFNKDRKVIIILDEFEKHNGTKAFESPDFLSFLDGANSRNNVIILATVNSMDKLPTVLTERPGRFEGIYEFTIKTDDVLRRVISGMLNGRMQGDDQLDRLVRKVKQFRSNPSMDDIKVCVRNEITKMLREEKEQQAKQKTRLESKDDK